MQPESEGASGSDWRRLHPLSPLLRAGRFGLIVLYALLEVAEELAGAEVAGGFFFAAAVAGALAYSWLAWRAAGYRIGPEELEIRGGVLQRFGRRVPLARIESVDVARPIFARMLGLADVRIEVVSQGASEAHLRYLSEARAEAVQAELVDARRAATGQPPAPNHLGPPTLSPPAPMLQVPTRELLVAYALTPIASFGAVASLLIFVIALISTKGGLVATGLSLIPLPAAALASAANIERFYGFRILDEGDALVIHRGLLNLQTQRIATGRVQAVRIDEPFLWRRFGRARLLVDVAGYRGASGETAARSAVLLPVGPPEVVAFLMAAIELKIDVPALGFEPVPDRARWRAPLRWKTYGLAQAAEHLVTRSGWVRRRTDIVPLAKLQSTRVTQGSWQRRLGLATLHLDTAGVQFAPRARHRDASQAAELAVATTLPPQPSEWPSNLSGHP